jgi:hypothetical protein
VQQIVVCLIRGAAAPDRQLAVVVPPAGCGDVVALRFVRKVAGKQGVGEPSSTGIDASVAVRRDRGWIEVVVGLGLTTEP